MLGTRDGVRAKFAARGARVALSGYSRGYLIPYTLSTRYSRGFDRAGELAWAPSSTLPLGNGLAVAMASGANKS